VLSDGVDPPDPTVGDAGARPEERGPAITRVHVLAPIGPTRAARGACVGCPGGGVATRSLRRPWTSARASMPTAR